MTGYDVVVVGAGVAGSLVAERLGRQGRRVLVLEAGAAEPGGPGPGAIVSEAGAAEPGAPGPATDPPTTGLTPAISGRTAPSRTPADTSASTAAPAPSGPASRRACSRRTSTPSPSGTAGGGR